LGHTELGHLSEGAEADVTISRLREGDFGFVDSKGIKIRGNRKLECELTLRAGKIVYDLNGLTAPLLKH
jgi:dihydroorotase